MPGWIIQGVRGEGKSLAAVGKIKEYMLKGRPVATNLTLYLDKFLPADNSTLAYRLPDHPRLVDLQLLPPAYDPKYKGEDKNGLLVLDELGTWLNARSWSNKDRLELLNWLFLSRKDHWDLILLAQDHEMIDAQVRTTLCDYLVQASRLDRQKIPYLAPVLGFLGFNTFMPRVHRYHVYYGLSTAQPPVETWNYTGKDFYDGYDTNQKFTNGMEALGGTLVDMRATYSYLPANYLTRHVFIERLHQQIKHLKDLKPLVPELEYEAMAKKTVSKQTEYLKIAFISLALIIFIGWRVASGGMSLPKASSSVAANTNPVLAAASIAPVAPVPSAHSAQPVLTDNTIYKAVQTNDFIEKLLKDYRPRLSTTAYSPELGIVGNIDFYDNFELVESYSVKELHSLGVTLIRRPYGVDLIYNGKSFIVSSWRLPVRSSLVGGTSATSSEPSVSGSSGTPSKSSSFAGLGL
jgi:hypothetical protein